MLKFHIIIIKFSIFTDKNSQSDTFFPKLKNTIIKIDIKSFSVQYTCFWKEMLLIQQHFFLSVWSPLKLTVWCGVHANGIIGPYFFRNEEGAAVAVNGVRYRHMLNTFLLPKNAEVKYRYFMVPTGQCYAPLSHRNQQFIYRTIW